PKLPSGLSPTIVGGELRQRLKFRGVTITDALEAGAIAPFGTPAQCSVLGARRQRGTGHRRRARRRPSASRPRSGALRNRAAACPGAAQQPVLSRYGTNAVTIPETDLPVL